MPYHVTDLRRDCPSAKPWAVVKDSDGTIMGCHETEEKALRQLAALNANEPRDAYRKAGR